MMKSSCYAATKERCRGFLDWTSNSCEVSYSDEVAAEAEIPSADGTDPRALLGSTRALPAPANEVDRLLFQ